LGAISGEATVQSYFADLVKWYLFSPPISDALGVIYKDQYVYSWYEPTYDWINETDTTMLFNAGEGYAVNMATVQTITYEGALNTGTVSRNLSFTDSGDPNDGWNLFGNPYPSLIDVSLFDFSNIAGGVYVYVHLDDSYVFWSKTLGTVGSSGGDGDDRARYIQPGQAFWINSNDDANGQSFSMTNAMRTHQNQGFFSKSATADSEETLNEILKINLLANSKTDPSYVVFRPGSGIGYDKTFDLRKMLSANPQVPHVFSLASATSDEKMAVNAIARPESQTVVPLGIKVGVDGDYQLSFTGMNSFDQTQGFYLRNLKTGEMIDLRNQSIVDFTYSTSDPIHLFDLVLGLQTGIGNPDEDSAIEAYSARNKIYIRLTEENASNKQVVVKNILGQTIYSAPYSSAFRSGMSIPVPSGIYILSIEQAGNSIYSKKILLQN